MSEAPNRPLVPLPCVDSNEEKSASELFTPSLPFPPPSRPLCPVVVKNLDVKCCSKNALPKQIYVSLPCMFSNWTGYHQMHTFLAQIFFNWVPPDLHVPRT